MEFADAIKEGDGDRVCLMVIHNSDCRNYAKEAALLLYQLQYLLSPQQAERVLYDRFVNTAGLPGRNISSWSI